MPKIHILVANNIDFEFLVSMSFYYLFVLALEECRMVGLLIRWLVFLSTLVIILAGREWCEYSSHSGSFPALQSWHGWSTSNSRTGLQKRLFGMAPYPQRKKHVESSAQLYILCIDLGYLHDLAEEVSCSKSVGNNDKLAPWPGLNFKNCVLWNFLLFAVSKLIIK